MGIKKKEWLNDNNNNNEKIVGSDKLNKFNIIFLQCSVQLKCCWQSETLYNITFRKTLTPRCDADLKWQCIAGWRYRTCLCRDWVTLGHTTHLIKTDKTLREIRCQFNRVLLHWLITILIAAKFNLEYAFYSWTSGGQSYNTFYT